MRAMFGSKRGKFSRYDKKVRTPRNASHRLRHQRSDTQRYSLTFPTTRHLIWPIYTRASYPRNKWLRMK